MSKIPGSSPRVLSLALGIAALGASAAILADTAMANGATTVVTIFAAQPALARNLTIKGNDANCAGNVTIEGTNVRDELISEVLALNGANLVTGSKAFKTVTRITLPAYAVANTERVQVGTGAKLGLHRKLSRNTVIAAFLANVRETTAPTVAFSVSALESNTITLNSALNGSAVIVDLYETL